MVEVETVSIFISIDNRTDVVPPQGKNSDAQARGWEDHKIQNALSDGRKVFH